jgi:hypothetical protein
MNYVNPVSSDNCHSHPTSRDEHVILQSIEDLLAGTHLKTMAAKEVSEYQNERLGQPSMIDPYGKRQKSVVPDHRYKRNKPDRYDIFYLRLFPSILVPLNSAESQSAN